MYTLRIYAYNLTHALKRGIGVSIKIPKRYFRVKHVAILGIWLFESGTPRFRASIQLSPFSDLDYRFGSRVYGVANCYPIPSYPIITQ